MANTWTDCLTWPLAKRQIYTNAAVELWHIQPICIAESLPSCMFSFYFAYSCEPVDKTITHLVYLAAIWHPEYVRDLLIVPNTYYCQYRWHLFLIDSIPVFRLPTRLDSFVFDTLTSLSLCQHFPSFWYRHSNLFENSQYFSPFCFRLDPAFENF